jgi:hypothetical protein
MSTIPTGTARNGRDEAERGFTRRNFSRIKMIKQLIARALGCHQLRNSMSRRDAFMRRKSKTGAQTPVDVPQELGRKVEIIEGRYSVEDLCGTEDRRNDGEIVCSGKDEWGEIGQPSRCTCMPAQIQSINLLSGLHRMPWKRNSRC